MPPEPFQRRSLADWLSYQERLHSQPIVLGLERVRAVADRMGLLPARATSIVVGGTNGKGSTTTLLAAIYRAAGYRVGAYLSPHLLRYNERIAIDGNEVDDATLCAAFARVEAARGEIALTYFEFGTLAAFDVFRQAQVEVQVLEVGLGGRLDAVNIVDADAAIVTNVGLDHTDFLGPDRDSIGWEKAGIFRPRRPAICADSDPPQRLLAHAQALGAELYRIERDFDASAEAGGMRWRAAGIDIELPLPGLAGAHQLRNAAAAIAAVQALQPLRPVAVAAIAAGLRGLRLAGRMELRGGALLDVAHNAEAAAVLAAELARRYPGQRLHWVAGLLSDKPVEAVTERLEPHIAEIWPCHLDSPRALSDVELRARLASCGRTVHVPQPPAKAWRAACAASQRDGETLPVLVCGSFLTVAAIEALL